MTRWSYGYSGLRETRSVLIDQHAALALRTTTRIVRFSGPPCRMAGDMSRDEIEDLEKKYGCRVDSARYQWGLK
jgi:hypothetical protein